DVVERDTLAAVAARFRVTESELLLWNSLDRAARLQAGQVLQLFVPETQSLAGIRHATPADVSVLEVGSPEFYAYFEGRAGRVRLVIPAKQGDTLTRIGGRYGIRPGSMERINQRSRREVLAAGEEVVVYVKPWRAAQAASAGVRVRVPASPPQAPSKEPVPAPPQVKAFVVPSRTLTNGGAR
ncbi:MAG TPA: LysM peptidoglycan-binding domain-containing protein, partial [Polyangiaceae bacterium]|nr:LysM peptidoglycan-binding domain-containing protein [Polyangiaceae bacterium]